MDPVVSLQPLAIPADAIVFDGDGGLVDSLVGVDHSRRRWALDFGLDPDVVLAHIHGRPSRESVERFIAESRRAADCWWTGLPMDPTRSCVVPPPVW